jgi:sigma-E factor negative regulatory protein RseC
MNGSGTVVRINGGKAVVLITAGDGCGACPAKCHCMSGDGMEREIAAVNDASATVGDTVAFEANQGTVLLSAALVWIVPIIAMFVGYMVADRFAEGIWPILAALCFLAASFGLLRLIDHAVAGGTAFYPHIVQVLPTGGAGGTASCNTGTASPESDSADR